MTTEEVTFVVNGQRRSLRRADVLATMQKQPAKNATRTWAVERADGVRFALKPVFSQATGLPTNAFTSQLAERTLRRLGFTVVDLHRERVTAEQRAPRNPVDRQLRLEMLRITAQLLGTYHAATPQDTLRAITEAADILLDWLQEGR